MVGAVAHTVLAGPTPAFEGAMAGLRGRIDRSLLFHAPSVYLLFLCHRWTTLSHSYRRCVAPRCRCATLYVALCWLSSLSCASAVAPPAQSLHDIWEEECVTVWTVWYLCIGNVYICSVPRRAGEVNLWDLMFVYLGGWCELETSTVCKCVCIKLYVLCCS